MKDALSLCASAVRRELKGDGWIKGRDEERTYVGVREIESTFERERERDVTCTRSLKGNRSTDRRQLRPVVRVRERRRIEMR